MSIVPLVQFAAPAASLTPLPAGPLLQLPAGEFRVMNHGRVLIHGQWVIALGVAQDLFLVLGTCSEKQVPPALKEQAAGYLTACGARVLRLRIRFPLAWHHPVRPERTIAFWIFRFVDTLSISMPAQLGAKRPRYALAIGVQARQAQCEWAWVAALWRAVEEEHPSALPPLDWLLWEVSHQWELRWALILRDAERHDFITMQERAEVEECDRTWALLFRHYLEPHGYELQPDTMARLL